MDMYTMLWLAGDLLIQDSISGFNGFPFLQENPVTLVNTLFKNLNGPLTKFYWCTLSDQTCLQ